MPHARATHLLFLACLAAHGAASAQQAPATSTERPWYVFGQQQIEHLSNATDSTKGNEVSDTVYTTTLGGGINARFGRQRAFANGSVSYTRYGKLDGLDGEGYNLGAGLNWETIGNLSGDLTVNAGRRQADFNTGINTLTLKNNETYEQAGARALWGGVGLFGIEGRVGWRQVGFSAPEFAAREYEQGSASAGVIYRPSSALTLGTGVAVEANDYDVPLFGQSQPESNERRDVYFTADWVASGASTLGGRLNIGKIDYDRANAEDFSGATGSVYWRWTPTGRTMVSVSFSRDSGQESGFQRLLTGDRARLTATDFSRITNNAAVSVGYDLTGKVKLTADLGYSRRSLVDSLTDAKGRDNTTTASLRADWAATRIVTVGCEVGYESRSASGFGSYDYSGNRIGCLGRVTLD
jgi:Putative beta-barrel porin 2